MAKKTRRNNFISPILITAIALLGTILLAGYIANTSKTKYDVRSRAAEPTQGPRVCDLNRDGVVNATDKNLMEVYLADESTSGDLNHDGRTDTFDSTIFNSCYLDAITTPTGGSGKPDLIITSVTATTQLYMCGDTDSGVRVYFQNQGTAPTATEFLVSVNGASNSVVESVNPGASGAVWVRTPWLQTGAQYTIQVDSSNKIDEANESNNTRSTTLALPTPNPTCGPRNTHPPTSTSTPRVIGDGPDLRVISMRIDEQSTSMCGTTPLGVRVYVTNSGSGPAGSFVVDVSGIQVTYAAGLTAGATGNVWVRVPNIFTGGSYTARVDVANTVTEINEANNTYSQFLAIPTPKPTCSPSRTPTPTQGFVTVTVRPSADAYVNNGYPNRNFGTATVLSVDATPKKRAYLKFNVTGITKPVRKARLWVYPNSSQSSGWDLHRTANTIWSETGITFNNAPSYNSTVIGNSARTTAGTWTLVDVTGVVNANGTYAFVLKTNGDTNLNLASRESANPPKLIIEQ